MEDFVSGLNLFWTFGVFIGIFDIFMQAYAQ